MELEKLEKKRIEEANNFEKLKLNLTAEKSENKVLVDAIREATTPEILDFVLKTLDKVEIKDQSIMAQKAGTNAFKGMGESQGQGQPKTVDDILDGILANKRRR